MFRPRFKDRQEAGRRLAAKLTHYAGRADAQVLALPRGGAPVAYEIARALGLPLDVFVVRKLGVPGQEELAFGAVASGGVRILNRDIIQAVALDEAKIAQVTKQEVQELERRLRVYRGNRPPLHIKNQTLILVDDGVATGASMRSAIAALRRLQPTHLVVAVPVAPPEVAHYFQTLVDEWLCLVNPHNFGGVGAWYRHFTQTTDEEVQGLLRAASSL